MKHPADCGWKGIDLLVLQDAGVVVEEDGLVRIPYRYRDGSVHRWRFVSSSGRRWWGPGEGLIPFGLETLPSPGLAKESTLLIAEGESDTLALQEAFADWHVIGLPGARSWRREWRLIVDPHPLVYVVADGDKSGRDMTERVCRDVTWGRPLWLPEGQDARSLVQDHGPRALDPYFDRADEVARLCAAFKTASTYDDFVQLLRGGEVHDAA
jgi:hypothetical protein